MSDERERLAQIAELISPCDPPNVWDGFDLCPGHPGRAWPCRETKAAWLARGLDPEHETRRAIDNIPKPHDERNLVMSDDEIIKAVQEALAWAETAPHGDLRMSAHRAAVIAVTAFGKALRESGRAVFKVQDVDNAINGDGQEAWAATARICEQLQEIADRRGAGPIVIVTPAGE